MKKMGLVFCGLWAIAAVGKPVVHENARFTVLVDECIRMEYSEAGAFVDAPSRFALQRESIEADSRVDADGALTIETSRMTLRYTPNGEPFSDENLEIAVKGFRRWSPSSPNDGNLGGTIRTLDLITGPVDLGEGLLSRNGWYLIDDSRNQLLTEDWVESRSKEAGLDWYFFGYGTDYKAALRALETVSGKVPMPRKYVLGAWYSRYWPYSSADYQQIINEYAEYDFPLDVIVLDMDWHKDGWTGWSINRELLPDFEELMDWFHEQGLFVTLNTHPHDGVLPHEDMYADFMRAMGKTKNDPPIPFDAGDQKYLETMFEYTHTPLEEKGVDFWWCDWQQYPFTRSIPDLTNLAWLNAYYYKHTGRDGLRGLSFSRWAGWGDHRHPIHFSGDADTTFEMLEFEIPFTSTAGNVGCFFWSHDIGGHMGARNEESYTRWCQFGATTAALRSHSANDPKMDRRPWKYSEWATDSMRIAFHLRSVLMPYIYSSVWQSCEEMLPLNRPMYLDYPEQEAAYHNAQQYFFGDHLLVAPIVEAGAGENRVASQQVWVPEGTWYNWFTNEKMEGPRSVVVAADINEFPLYVRGGAPIPLQNYAARMTTAPLDELVIRCYPGEEGTRSFTLYEDDGVTTKYQGGNYRTTELSCTKSGELTTLTIEPAQGNYADAINARAYRIELPAVQRMDQFTCSVAGARMEDGVIFIPATAVTERVVISVALTEADPAIAAAATSERLGSLAARGVALVRKNKGAYLYEGEIVNVFYSGEDVLDGDTFTWRVFDQMGDKTTVYKEEALACTDEPQELDLGELPPLVNPFGVSAERIVEVSFKVDGKPVTLRKTLDSRTSYLTKWQVSEPFPFDVEVAMEDQVFAPERQEPVEWEEMVANERNVVGLRERHNLDGKLIYAKTQLVSPVQQKVTFGLNSDDGSQLWVNGEQIHCVNARRGINHNTEWAEAILEPGENQILLKVSQHDGGWEFKVSIKAQHPLD